MALSALSIQLSDQSETLTGEGRAKTSLLVADSHCPQIGELLAETTMDRLCPSAHQHPLVEISQWLAERRSQGESVDTLHIVAHGRPGSLRLGNHWLTATDLLTHAQLLLQWNLRHIALWSCHLAQDADVLALWAELTGAQIFATADRLNRQHTRIQSCGPGGETASLSLDLLVPAHRLAQWNGNLEGDDALGASEPIGASSAHALFENDSDTGALGTALQEAERLINGWLQGDAAAANLHRLFNGGSSEASAAWLAQAESFRAGVLAGELSVKVELRSSAELLNAYGAYAASGPDGRPVIYLNETWVEQFSQDELTRLVLEETGHWIDNQINGTLDTPGDEGEAFAATVLGLELRVCRKTT